MNSGCGDSHRPVKAFSLYLFNLEANPNPKMKQCRFCLETGNTKKNPLVAPCECKGSVEFVHRACLVRWARIDPAQNAQTCTICKQPFTIELLPQYEDTTVGTQTENIVLHHYTVVAIGFHYFSLSLLLDTKKLGEFPQAFYQSTLLANIFSHAFYVRLLYTLWRVKNVRIYWDLFVKSKLCLVASYHAGLLVLCIALKNGLLGTFIHILWNTYWREHLLLLGKVNEVLNQEAA